MQTTAHFMKKKGRIRQWTLEVQAARLQAEVRGIKNVLLTFSFPASENMHFGLP
jgi:hypothetical protein